jgi:hypothetical protein
MVRLAELTRVARTGRTDPDERLGQPLHICEPTSRAETLVQRYTISAIEHIRNGPYDSPARLVML